MSIVVYSQDCSMG